MIRTNIGKRGVGLRISNAVTPFLANKDVVNLRSCPCWVLKSPQLLRWLHEIGICYRELEFFCEVYQFLTITVCSLVVCEWYIVRSDLCILIPYNHEEIMCCDIFCDTSKILVVLVSVPLNAGVCWAVASNDSGLGVAAEFCDENS